MTKPGAVAWLADSEVRTKEDAEQVLLDRTFFALSDPVRRAILERLGEGSFLVSELAAPFDMTLQAVSQHIQVLVRAGLIQQERTGRVSRCSIEVAPIFAAAVWINQYSRYWQTQFEALAGWLDSLTSVRPRKRTGRVRMSSGRRRQRTDDTGSV
jgi:DNA-binding transcriptional ArsR family regulator